MHYYNWFQKSRSEQEGFKKKSQASLCPDCNQHPSLGSKDYEMWTCVGCEHQNKKEKKET
jgi:ribosomal protein L37AE/L43A|tara:strand:+ start:2768 stop:2947 length:180 start_codon:yes stop_codon:yes gene_type:complete